MLKLARSKNDLSDLRCKIRERRRGVGLVRSAFAATLGLVGLLCLGSVAVAATITPVDADGAGKWTQSVRNPGTAGVSRICIVRDGATDLVGNMGCTTGAVAAGATVTVAATLTAGDNALFVRAVAVNDPPAGSSAAPVLSAASADTRLVSRGPAVPPVPFLLP